jgi:hypothetical protein
MPEDGRPQHRVAIDDGGDRLANFQLVERLFAEIEADEADVRVGVARELQTRVLLQQFDIAQRRVLDEIDRPGYDGARAIISMPSR